MAHEPRLKRSTVRAPRRAAQRAQGGPGRQSARGGPESLCKDAGSPGQGFPAEKSRRSVGNSRFHAVLQPKWGRGGGGLVTVAGLAVHAVNAGCRCHVPCAIQ